MTSSMRLAPPCSKRSTPVSPLRKVRAVVYHADLAGRRPRTSPPRENIAVNFHRRSAHYRPAEMLLEVAQHAPSLLTQIAAARIDHRLSERRPVAMRPQHADRTLAGDRPERRNVGDDRHGAAGTRF